MPPTLLIMYRYFCVDGFKAGRVGGGGAWPPLAPHRRHTPVPVHPRIRDV